MRYQSEDMAGRAGANTQGGLPAPRDCETLVLLRAFLRPILETAASWQDILVRLSEKGYGLAFREGHLVILDEAGQGLCTGSSLGIPLREIAARIGRPAVRASADGHAGELH